VRRHYIQAFAERIGAFFPDVSRRPREERQNWRRERGGDNRRTPPARRPIAISDRLRRSTILTGRSSYSLREVVLVVTMINHPELIAAHLDAFAHIEFTHADLDRVRGAVLEIAADGEEWQAEALRARLGEGPNAAILARLDAQIDAIGHWPAKPGASSRDAEEGWLQALTLHLRKGTLHRELKDAEAALAAQPSEANLARLVEIQKQLASSEGTEALIDGFGASSGRERRVF
jgi:DNA primase